jgi:glycosyltransferase involved in cell wall biosynthesis
MANKKPLLSICIPTYNRADILDKSIASIVTQPEFYSGDVELVVSDNASDDNTEEVVKKYQKKHKNIFYSRNNKNIRDKNFPMVIGKAHGVFRKLCNDTLIFKEGSVGKIINIVKSNAVEKPVLFFLNKAIKRIKWVFYATNSFDAFLRIVSFYSTWIGGFGIWEDDYKSITDKFSGCELSLWQTKILFEMCSNKNKYIVENSKLFDVGIPKKKNISYGLYNIFYKNYLGLYKKHIISHNISRKTFSFLRKDLLFRFFLLWIVNAKYDYEQYVLSENEDFYQLIWENYKKEKYFIFFLLNLRLLSIKKYIKKVILLKLPLLSIRKYIKRIIIGD